MAACSAGGDAEGATTPSTTTATTAVLTACEGSPSTDPVVLQDAPGTATVVDLVARPSGQLVALGTSIWVRDPGRRDWRAVAAPPPGGAQQAATAAAASGGEVWVATNDALGTGAPSQLHRSTDLETWVTEPVVLDGAASAAAINALTLVGERWLALLQDGDMVTVAASPDGRDWESTATIPLRVEGDVRRAVFDIGERDGHPVIVGFVLGDLRPVMIDVRLDGSVSDVALSGDDLTDVRLWGMATLDGGRPVLAADQVSFDPAGEPSGFTTSLYEATGAGSLDRLITLPSPAPFAVPADLVVVGDEVVVAGSLGDTRRTLSPAVWSLCRPSA